MKAGEVVQMRIGTSDLLTCLDVVEATMGKTDGLSLAAAVSQAIKTMCAVMRQEKGFPLHEGWNYQQRVDRYKGTGHGTKVKNTQDMERAMLLQDSMKGAAAWLNADTGTRSGSGPLDDRASLLEDWKNTVSITEQDEDIIKSILTSEAAIKHGVTREELLP
jgi:hypothetical protein